MFIHCYIYTLLGQYHYNPVFFPVSSDFLYIHTNIVKWLPRKSDLFKAEPRINVFYR